jgi:drug/metabolite transporter (DMT)-like permease
MLAAAATFSLMTTLVKSLGGDYPAAVQNFYRQAAGLLILAPVIVRNPVAAFRTTRPGLLLFRSAAGTVATMLSFYSYQKMPLADANVLSFTRTLWLVPLAAFVLREKVGPRRIGATLVGFAGVLFMVQPGAASAAPGWPTLAALIAALLFAFTITGMKVMTRDHSPLILMAWAAALGFVFAIPPAMFSWRWPGAADLLLLTIMGALGTITQGCYIKGIALGDAAAMAPIDYTRLVFAIMLGYLMFHDTPNATTLIGAAIVIGSTFYITWRESRLGVTKPAVVEGR